MTAARSVRRTSRWAAFAVAAILIGSGAPGAATEEDTDPAKERAALYFVITDEVPLALHSDEWDASGLNAARRSQEPSLAAARALGGSVGFRYSRAVNGFSARLTASAARELAEAPGVARVEAVPIVRSALSGSVGHIGTKKAWSGHRVKGKGVHVAVIDSGVDYTHQAFRGAGTRSAYKQNDPEVVEPGSFPTRKVVAGYDFVGDDYDVLDNSASNDVPQPDEDPLDPHAHGTHVAHTCCGKRVRGIGKGVAPKARIHAYKVWGMGGSSTADVLVAAYERALDPNQDGNLEDRVDVVNFSGGVYYGTPSSTESVAASNMVAAGVTFVAAAGNSAGHAYRVGAPATADGVISVAASQFPSDRMAGFSSAGPARAGSGFKPEVTAPGQSILAAAAGTGDAGVHLSGTSMAAPHVTGAAALLVELHPLWSPAAIKSALVNHADPLVTARGSTPGPATLIGAGLVQVDRSADAVSLAMPSTISFGSAHTGLSSELSGAPFTVVNKDKKGHRYILRSKLGYATVAPDAASVALSVDGDPPAAKVSFWLKPKAAKIVTPHLSLEPGLLSEDDLSLARYGQLPLIDGAVVVRQRKNGRDKLRVPWLVVPHAASNVSLGSDEVDLSGDDATLDLVVDPTAGVPAADTYVLGGEDPQTDVALSEADIVAFGARSFAGAGLDDGAEGLPEVLDARSNTWLSSMTAEDLEEPVEIGIVTAGMHDTIEELEVKVFIDAGADGVFSDPAAEADYVVVKRSFGRSACVRALPSSGGCSAGAGADYDAFNSDLIGLVFDALDVGLSESDPVFSYRVEVCSDTFSGDVPNPVCDSTPGLGPDGTYPARLDVTVSAPLPASPFCGGFWSESDCRSGLELSGAPSDPDVLVIFPNNAPGSSHAIVRTP